MGNTTSKSNLFTMGFCLGFGVFRMSLVLPGSEPDVFGQAQNHPVIMSFLGIIQPPSDLWNGWSWGGHPVLISDGGCVLPGVSQGGCHQSNGTAHAQRM